MLNYTNSKMLLDKNDKIILNEEFHNKIAMMIIEKRDLKYIRKIINHDLFDSRIFNQKELDDIIHDLIGELFDLMEIMEISRM